MNNKINMFLNIIMEAENYDDIERMEVEAALQEEIREAEAMMEDKEDQYDFNPKPGETFDDVERRQINAALQEEIREAERIIAHFFDVGSAYGTDITVDEIGDPIPPPLDESGDESEDEFYEDLKREIEAPSNPNNRISQIRKRKNWTWTGISELHRNGAYAASKLLFKLIDFTGLIVIFQRKGYDDEKIQKLIRIIQHAITNGLFKSFHIAPELMREKFALMNIEADKGSLEQFLIKILHFGLFTKSGKSLMQLKGEFIYKTLFRIVKMEPVTITRLFNGIFEAWADTIESTEIDDDYVVYYDDGIYSLQVNRAYNQIPLEPNEVRFPNLFKMRYVSQILATYKKVPFEGQPEATFIEYLRLKEEHGISNQDVMELWKTKMTPTGMQSLEPMSLERSLLEPEPE